MLIGAVNEIKYEDTEFKMEKLLEVGRVVKEDLGTVGIWVEAWMRNSQLFTKQKKELPGTEKFSQFKCTVLVCSGCCNKVLQTGGL